MKYEYDYALSGEDVEWLIEQAGRVQELEKYYISEKRLKELLNGNEDIGELYQFVEDNQKIEDVISMLIKEMGYLAGALDDYNKGFFELEKQNKRYRKAIDYVMKTEAGHYSNMYELIEDVKLVINKTLGSETE